MNPLDRLTEYLRRVERRLRLLAWTRGAALTMAGALAFTVLLVLVANHFAFSGPSVLWARIALFLALAFVLGAGLVMPVLRLNRRRAAREAEHKFPDFEERLLTFSERVEDNPRDPFLALLADDTLAVAQRSEPVHVAGHGRVWSFASTAAGSLVALLWLGTSGPGFLGYGTSLLWGGLPKGDLAPYYDIQVKPGTRTLRRRSDQVIAARLVGFHAQRVRVLARYDSSSKWEEADMRPEPGGPNYQFLFAGVPESLAYYVEADGVRSKQFRLNVVDLPSVRHIRVTYHFPAWTGMKDAVEDPGGDLRAVEGTLAEVALQTDRPLANGVLLLDDGRKLPLRASSGNWLAASVPIEKDGLYHLASLEQSEDVRLSEDYFIEARKDEPPAVRITRPGRDARVNPIEEVAITVEGNDDFGLQELTLHYSVNGGAEQNLPMLKSKGAKTASGETTIYLENFKLLPGDLVSLYATARDARALTRTDMFFVEAQPFEREFSQSQQAGGGGGGDDESGNRISQRQKEIIAATWNQIKDKSSDKAAGAENARFLAGVQSKLRDQARSLANRMRSRQLSGANQAFQSFAEDMEKAVEAMGPATDKLRASEWQSALAPEQKALQHLLRAEATFRDIQVAFGRGGGGGGGGLGRDLEGLFDLELDTEKNQYEAGQSASADQRQREIDEALQKLEQLARRQQELAEQQRRNPQTSQQRWQQEMLRREAEQLQRKMEQLARGSSSMQQSQQGQAGQQGPSGQQSQSGRPQSGGQSAQSEQLQQAIERLSQATRDMRQAGASASSGSAENDAQARRAAERLREAREMLGSLRRQQAEGQVSELTRQAEQLAGQQRAFENRMRQSFGAPGSFGQQGQGSLQPGLNRQQTEQMADEKQQIGNDLQKLESEIQKAVRDLAAAQRQTSSKLRDALGNLQQQELGLRMRWSAEAIRRGLGAYAAMREAVVTQALNNLRDELRQAENSLTPGGQESGQKNLEQALAQTERLRRQMEQMSRGQNPNGKAQGPGSDQKGSGGTGGQPDPSSRGLGTPGRGSGEDRTGRAGSLPAGGSGSGSFSAMNRGDWQPPAGGVDPRAATPEGIEQAYAQGLRELSQLQHSLENEPEVTRDIQELIREMQRLDPRRFPGNPALVERLLSQMLGGIEEIELRLRRALDEKQGSSVRSGAGQPVPPGYADAVAEYFRRLSKEK